MGFHKNHYHSHGWLSSAFYLTVPDVVNAGGKEGWIKFGEPGFRAREPLSPEHWLQPEEGALAIFPSYLWHGTEALQSDVERMTVALMSCQHPLNPALLATNHLGYPRRF